MHWHRTLIMRIIWTCCYCSFKHSFTHLSEVVNSNQNPLGTLGCKSCGTHPYLTAVACKFTFIFFSYLHCIPAFKGPFRLIGISGCYKLQLKTYWLLRPTYGRLCFCNTSVLTYSRLWPIMTVKGAFHRMSRFSRRVTFLQLEGENSDMISIVTNRNSQTPNRTKVRCAGFIKCVKFLMLSAQRFRGFYTPTRLQLNNGGLI